MVFFYISLIIIWAVFIGVLFFKRLSISNIIIGIATVGYSMVFDILFGEYLNLYYYISNSTSQIYVIISAIFIYPILNIIYTIFIPKNKKRILSYTSIWIIAMLTFEYISFSTKTILLTGWRTIPFSIIVYIITYTIIYTLYIYLNNNYIEHTKNSKKKQ